MRHLISILEGIFDADIDAINYNDELLSLIGSSRQKVTCSIEGSTLYIDSDEPVYNITLTKCPDRKYGIKKIVFRGGIDKVSVKGAANFRDIDIETPGPVIVNSGMFSHDSLTNMNIKCLYLIFQGEGGENPGQGATSMSLHNINVELTKPNGIIMSKYDEVKATECTFRHAEFVYFDCVRDANKFLINDIFEPAEREYEKASPTYVLKEFAKRTTDLDRSGRTPISHFSPFVRFERTWPACQKIVVRPPKSSNVVVYTKGCNPKSRVAKFAIKLHLGWKGYISKRYLDEVQMNDE
jgi:hypothetical protein